MKKKLSHPLRFAVFGLIFLVIMGGLSYLFYPKNNQKEFGMDNPYSSGFLGEKSNSLDVFLVGDSEVYSAFSPMQMWKEHGFTSFESSSANQYLYDTYRYLMQMYKKQSPKVIVLETNTIYRNCNVVNTSVSKLLQLVPILHYHHRWKTLTANDFGEPIRNTWTDDLKGYSYEPQVKGVDPGDYMAKTDNVKKITALNRLYLQKIADLCKKQGSELLLVSTPSPKNWNYERHNGVQAFADSNGIPYLDMNLLPSEEFSIDWQNDTRDQGDHLNFSGAQKASAYLGWYLKAHYELPDHRGDSEYAKWNESLERYLKMTSSS